MAAVIQDRDTWMTRAYEIENKLRSHGISKRRPCLLIYFSVFFLLPFVRFPLFIFMTYYVLYPYLRRTMSLLACFLQFLTIPQSLSPILFPLPIPLLFPHSLPHYPQSTIHNQSFLNLSLPKLFPRYETDLSLIKCNRC